MMDGNTGEKSDWMEVFKSPREAVLTLPLGYSQCSLDNDNILAAMCRSASSSTLDLP